MGQYLQFRSWARRSSGAEKGVLATSLAVVLGLTGWALERGTSLDGLEVSRPTLEDVYLSLTAEATPGIEP